MASPVLGKVQDKADRALYDDTDWTGGANALAADVRNTLGPATRPIAQSLDRIDRVVKSNSMVAEGGRAISNSLAAASGAVEATTKRASIMIQKNFRGKQAREEVKREFHLDNVVMQARACSKVTSQFKKLTKPRRPPFPGTATPPGYVIHLKKPPRDRDNGERFRDWLLWLGTHRWVAALQLVWLLALVAVFVVFVCCLMYWFSWGEQTDFEWGCTANSTCCTCDAATGALTYKLEDLWQERMTQGLSALFTYSVLLATPWRVSVLVQLFHRRTHDKGGVDFYGVKNEMPFFHIPWNARLAIAIFLNLNTLMQLIHQVLHFVWHDVVMYFEQPEGLISVATGPIAGFLTGAPAAIIQIYHEDKLHTEQPERFPPGPLQVLHNYFGKPDEGDDGGHHEMGTNKQQVMTDQKAQTLAAKLGHGSKRSGRAEEGVGGEPPKPAAAETAAVEVSVEKV